MAKLDPKTVAIAKTFLTRVGLAAARGASDEVKRAATGAAAPMLDRVEAISNGVIETVRAAREALRRASEGGGGRGQ